MDVLAPAPHADEPLNTPFEPSNVHVARRLAPYGAITLGAGLSAGVFIWYVFATHSHPAPRASDLALIVFLLAGGVVAVSSWYWYSHWISRHYGIDPTDMLHADAWSFFPLFGLWLFLFENLPSLTSAAALCGVLLLIVVAAKVATVARYIPMVRHVSTVFIATRIPLIIIAPLAAVLIGQRQGQHWSASRGLLLDVWGRWDAQHYLTIASAGYQGREMAFFPLYPYLVHVFGGLIGDHLTAALIISNLAFLVALGYFYALLKLEFGDESVAFHAIFYIAIFPTAIFFSAVYTESLFLALTVASVYYARHGNYVTSGIFGALASMTRVEGMLTAIPLAYEAWHGWKERGGTALTRGAIGVALVPVGLLAYMGYLYALVGDPLFFLKIQDNWNRHLAPPWVSIVNTVKEIRMHPVASGGTVNHFIELTFTLAFIALVVIAFKKLRMSYALYFAASLLMPMSTASLMSMPRFVLVMFPAFMLMALWGRNPVVNSAIVSLSLPLLGLFTVLFADWYWLA
ncbi:MAG: glycosyltransferase family 39 protein [Candidatus Eremiobacteraeota bacterium]|nr:glycosyltransferase family 39 protein [Candidatus Eremiobacteraeota bacterium]